MSVQPFFEEKKDAGITPNAELRDEVPVKKPGSYYHVRVMKEFDKLRGAVDDLACVLVKVTGVNPTPGEVHQAPDIESVPLADFLNGFHGVVSNETKRIRALRDDFYKALF